jgi:hypothetical protein
MSESEIGKTYILFHPFDTGARPMTYPLGDFWCSIFRFYPYVIRTGDGKVPSDRSGVAMADSLQEALEDPRLDGFKWVWLDHRAETYMNEYHHPRGNVIYVLGHDVNGFGDVEPVGDLIQVRFGSTNEVHSSLILPLLCYDRFAYIAGGGR